MASKNQAQVDSVEEDINAAWETESGLIDDVDGWITNPRFGFKEEYAQAVSAVAGMGGGAMFIVDIADEQGIIQGSQGYSIGTGWEVSDDGRYITHPKRNNVVTATLYGQLQRKVVKDLGVNMGELGDPTDAMSWDGLGFHWNQIPHATVGGEEKTGLMPTEYIGVFGEGEAEAPAKEAQPAANKAQAKAAPKPAAGSKVSPAKIEALKLLGDSGNAKEFMMKAVKVPEIVADDALMAECMDDSENGFFAQNKG